MISTPFSWFPWGKIGPHTLSLIECDLSVACQAKQKCYSSTAALLGFFPRSHTNIVVENFSFCTKETKQRYELAFSCHCDQSKCLLPFTKHGGKAAGSLLPISRPTILLVSSAWQDNLQILKALWCRSSSQELTLLHACNTWHLVTLCFHFLKIVYDYAPPQCLSLLASHSVIYVRFRSAAALPWLRYYYNLALQVAEQNVGYQNKLWTVSTFQPNKLLYLCAVFPSQCKTTINSSG